MDEIPEEPMNVEESIDLDKVVDITNTSTCNSISSNTVEEVSATKSQASKVKLNLQLSKVKSIIKSDPDVSLTGSETIFLMTKMTELFIGHFANRAYHYTKLGKRKTVQERDVLACISTNDELSFLEGILDCDD